MTEKNETEKLSYEVATIQEAEQRFRDKESLIMSNVQDIKNKMKVEKDKNPSDN